MQMSCGGLQSSAGPMQGLGRGHMVSHMSHAGVMQGYRGYSAGVIWLEAENMQGSCEFIQSRARMLSETMQILSWLHVDAACMC